MLLSPPLLLPTMIRVPVGVKYVFEKVTDPAPVRELRGRGVMTVTRPERLGKLAMLLV